MAMTTCPNCGEQISDKAKKCVHCGAVLISEEKKYCPDCGTKLEPGMESCPKCGCPVENTTATDPSGSLHTYSQNFNDADNETLNCYNALKMYLEE